MIRLLHTARLLLLASTTLLALQACTENELPQLLDRVENEISRVDKDKLAAARNGDTIAAVEIALPLIDGATGNREGVELGEAILVATGKQSAYASVLLGGVYLEGVVMENKEGQTEKLLKDTSKAIYWLERYMHNQPPDRARLTAHAIALLGKGYAASNQPGKAFQLFQEHEETIRQWDMHGLAAFEYANLYRNGIGTEADLDKALAWYDIAAKAGHNMAIMERNFLDIERQKKKKAPGEPMQ